MRLRFHPALVLSASLLLANSACLPEDEPPPPAETCDPTTVAAVTHASDISVSETWARGVHVVESSLTVRAGARLTIAPCARVELAADVALVADDESLGIVAEGTAAAPIDFVRLVAGEPWGALEATAPATISLAHANLVGGGSSGVGVAAERLGASLAAFAPADTGGEVLRVDSVTVRDSTGIGVVLIGAEFDARSASLVVTRSGAQPVYLGADRATNLPSGAYTGNELDEILLQQAGPAGYSNDQPILGEVILRERGVPYRVGAAGTGGGEIRIGDSRPESPDASLTIEPGVTLRFTPQSSQASQILVMARYVDGTYEAQGALIAEGTAARPIVFTSAAATPAPGDWRGLYFKDVVDPRSSITHAVIEYAGGDSASIGVCLGSLGATNADADAALVLFLGSSSAPSRPFVSATRFSNSAGAGVYRQWQVTDVDFVTGNTFESIAGCWQTDVANDRNACPDPVVCER